MERPDPSTGMYFQALRREQVLVEQIEGLQAERDRLDKQVSELGAKVGAEIYRANQLEDERDQAIKQAERLAEALELAALEFPKSAKQIRPALAAYRASQKGEKE